MASLYAIDAPHTLFTIPRPLDPVAGRTLPGSSYSINGSKKRKRAEVVLGVDGESINVYDFKTPKLLTTHAIPPQAYLTARPCCAQSKSTADRASQRYTYAALRNDLGTASHEVICFREGISGSSSSADPSTSLAVKSRIPIGSYDDAVVFAEPIIRPKETDDDVHHELLMVQEKGDIVGLSADLSHENWRKSLQSLSTDTTTEESRVKYAFTQSAAVARRGVLRGREDLVALFDPTGQNDAAVLEQTTILCLVTVAPSTGETYLHVLALAPRTSGSLRAVPLQRLVRWQLPSKQVDASGKPVHEEYKIDNVSGSLFKLADGSLKTYTFSSLGPKPSSSLQIPERPIEGFLPAPHALAFVATPGYCSLYNMHYTSLQAGINLKETYTYSTQSRKRKRTESVDTNPSVHLLDFFPKDNLIVGIVGVDLVIFSVRMHRSSVKAGRLIDSLGHGIVSANQKNRTAPAATDAEAISVLATSDPSLEALSKRVNKGTVMALSGAIEALKHLLRSFNTPIPAPIPQTHLLTNGTAKPDDELLESTLSAEEAALSADLDLATSLLSPNALTARASALKAVISLLGVTYPTQSVSQALRRHLHRRDILFLVDLLRLDMERGGWTSRCLDMWPDADDQNTSSNSTANQNEKPQDGAIAVVCKVLNCSLDALGMGAWVTSTHAPTTDVAASDDEDEEQQMNHEEATHSTITLLRTDTEAVLECAQESAFFTGLLGEFLRYERAVAENKSSPKSTKAALPTNSSTSTAVVLGPSAATHHSALINAAATAGVQESMLPLGVRGAQGVSKTRVGAGGEVQRRSRRSVANEKSKRTGVYAFERVRF